MRAQLCLYYFALFLLLSCSDTVRNKVVISPEQKDSIRYDNIILSAAFGNAALAPDTLDLYQGYEKIERMILRRKEIVDSSLGIVTRFHQWDASGGYQYRKRLIYISNMKNFEFLLPFTDEYYRFHADVSIKNDLDRLSNLGTQLNYAIFKLGIDKDSNNNRVNQFISLVLDSLIGLREYRLKDTGILKKYSEINDTYNDACIRNNSKNIIKIISELENSSPNNVRFFSCAEGFKTYWRIGIFRKNSTINISPSLVNTECYRAYYW
jgi:hypothetical protein